jgi:hypothetical protein
MHNNRTGLIKTAAAVAALAGITSHAQSSDALIDKLVDKGILTVKEANELREEADKGFSQAYQVKSGMPDWVTALRFNGDFRGRYDSIYAPANAPGVATRFTDRSRWRYRARFGVTAVMKDQFEAGFRLTSGEAQGALGGDPISGNVSYGDNASKKFVYIDLAYGKWTPINNPDWSVSATVGKMENPFVVSEMLFDPDYTPEGGGLNIGYNINDKHSLKLNGGAFVLDELGGATGGSESNPFLLGGQLRLESLWTPKIQTSFGAAVFAISDESDLPTGGVPDRGSGNSRTGAGAAAFPSENFTTLVFDGGATYTLESFPLYNGPFPIRVGAEYAVNTAADDRNEAYGFGVTFGKSGKKGLWDISYRWKEMQGDFFYEELPDSDFGGWYQLSATKFGASAGYRPGVNLRGHVIKAQYSLFDAFTLSGTVYIADVIDSVNTVAVPKYDSQAIRLQVDALFKF